jgi:hypothetical protein
MTQLLHRVSTPESDPAGDRVGVRRELVMLSQRQSPVPVRLLLTALLVSLASCSSTGESRSRLSSARTPTVLAPSADTLTTSSPSTTSRPTATTALPPIELDVVGGCDEAAFFARSEDDTIAVSIYYEATNRNVNEATTVYFTLPDPMVTVFLLHGALLSQALCADITYGAYSKTAEVAVRTGSGTLSIDPPPTSRGSCGDRGGVHGQLHLVGLTDLDGTAIAPIDVATNLIGCIVS